MKKFTKRSLIISSTLIASMLFSIGTGIVQADNVNSNTETISINKNDSVPDKSTILPVASNGNQTLRQVAKNNNISLDIAEKLNENIDPDKVIPNGTPLYLPQNEDLMGLLPSLATVHTKISNALYQKYYGRLSPSERAAKIWIAQHESSFSYTVRNGRYYGRFQLDISYLHGDLSVANQERTADRYVKNRYGSWVATKRFWLSHHWY